MLGIRAYDTQKDLAANNKKLLDFVAAGGTLVVQYNAGVGDFNAGHFTPYPAELSRARVSVEDAPVIFSIQAMKSFTIRIRLRREILTDGYRSVGFTSGANGTSTTSPCSRATIPGKIRRRVVCCGHSMGRELISTLDIHSSGNYCGRAGCGRLFVNLLSAGHQERSLVVGR